MASQHVCFTAIEGKILELLPCMAHELDAEFAKQKGPRLSLQVPTTGGALPYFIADLPAPVFAAVVSLCEAGQLSFTTVSAREAKLTFIGHKPRFPLLSLDMAAGQQYLLPMRLVAGVAPGEAGGGGAGRFFAAGASATAFRCAVEGQGEAPGLDSLAGALRVDLHSPPTSFFFPRAQVE
jgi:hypothetical protein